MCNEVWICVYHGKPDSVQWTSFSKIKEGDA
jgi:hypothetical protein